MPYDQTTGSLYLDSELYERIALAQEAYRKADWMRDPKQSSYAFGSPADQFCEFLVECIGDMTNEEFDELFRFDAATDLYERAFEYYPEFAPLLDADEV